MNARASALGMRDTRFFSSTRARRPWPLDRARPARASSGPRTTRRGFAAHRGRRSSGRSRHRRARPRRSRTATRSCGCTRARSGAKTGFDARRRVLRDRDRRARRIGGSSAIVLGGDGRAVLRRGHAARTTGSTGSRSGRSSHGGRAGRRRSRSAGGRCRSSRAPSVRRSSRRRDRRRDRADARRRPARRLSRRRRASGSARSRSRRPGVTYRQRAAARHARSPPPPAPDGPVVGARRRRVGGAVVDVVDGLRR